MRYIEKTVRIFHSFKEQEEAGSEFRESISGEEKLRMLEEMRAQ